MVANIRTLLTYIRLSEIFSCENNKQISGIFVIGCRVLFQLPFAKLRALYASCADGK